jgi:hypothetical protein
MLFYLLYGAYDPRFFPAYKILYEEHIETMRHTNDDVTIHRDLDADGASSGTDGRILLNNGDSPFHRFGIYVAYNEQYGKKPLHNYRIENEGFKVIDF